MKIHYRHKVSEDHLLHSNRIPAVTMHTFIIARCKPFVEILACLRPLICFFLKNKAARSGACTYQRSNRKLLFASSDIL